MHAICIFDFMNFVLLITKFIEFKPIIGLEFNKFELHNYILYRLAAAKLGRLVLCRTTCISLGPFTLHTYRTPITILTVQRFDIEHNV